MTRTRTNSHTSNPPKKNKWMTPIIVLLSGCIVGALAYKLLSGGTSQSGLEKVALVQPTSPQAPEAATIYIDDSGSMAGYVKGQDFIYAMADLMNIYTGTKAQAVNDTMVITQGSELVTKLQSGAITVRKESLLHEDLKKIVDKVVKTKNIAFFVTDGIMSGSTQQINNNPRYNIDQKQNLMHDISNVFKGKGVAVSVYRLTSDFNGPYYCYDNSNKIIHTRRPYFVLAIGSANVVADFKQRLETESQNKLFKFRPSHMIHFIDNQPINERPLLSGGKDESIILPVDTSNVVLFDRQKVDQASDGTSGVLNVSIPMKTLGNYALSPNELMKNVEIYTDGTRYKPLVLKFDSIRNCIKVQIDRAYLSTANNYGSLRIAIPYLTPKWIDNPDLSIEDDHFMLNPALASEGTFLLDHFIQGIKNNGVLPSSKDNTYIYDCTLYFKEK